jgi:hypothetical protein
MKAFINTTYKLIPGVYLPLRASIIKLENATILMSPVEMSNDEIKSIRASETITDIISPSLFHHHFAKEAIDDFPQAHLWAAPGLKEKCPDVPWQKTLTVDPWPYNAELELLFIKGAPKINECVFYHRASHTLYVSDLCFNIENPKGFLTPITFRLLGSYKKFAVSNIWKKLVTDRKAFKASMDKLFSWNFDRIVMGHGEILELDAKARLKKSLQDLELI